MDAAALALQPLAFWLGLPRVGHHVPLVGDAVRAGGHRHSRRAAVGAGLLRPVRVGRGDRRSALYGVSQSDAATWALLFHIASFIPITLIGAYYFARLGFTMGDIGAAATERDA